MTEQEVKRIIANALEVDRRELDDEISEAWDSLGHLNVLIALDMAYDGKLAEIKEMQTAYSVGGIIDILRQNGLVS